jgi:septal ring factor EnvC (AmiA/AmiB activator)
MATKEDIAALGEQVASIEQELKTIARDLNKLKEDVQNITGYRKEIDHALERIAAIERHLGIKHPAR